MTDNRDVRYNPERRNRWQDWANFVLAIWLFFSPWILSFGSATPAAAPAQGAQAVNAVSNAAWNAWVLGVLVFLVAISAISRMEFWQEWINLLLGAWIFIAPWVLGFARGTLSAASCDYWIVGALIFLISAGSISMLQSSGARHREVHHRP